MQIQTKLLSQKRLLEKSVEPKERQIGDKSNVTKLKCSEKRSETLETQISYIYIQQYRRKKKDTLLSSHFIFKYQRRINSIY